MLKYTIVVPCFNEGKRILTDEYLKFLNANPEFNFLFVDDGSIDNTKEVLSTLFSQTDKIQVIALKKNQGKAQAIYNGVQNILNNNSANFIGYLDADLAIPFSEVLRLKEKISQGYEIAFSSKKPTQGSDLEIKFKRYFVGRVLSTMVRFSLKLKIYDTQCGCKLMTKELAKIGFEKPFTSSWLFDIELFWRIITVKGRFFFNTKSVELPVKRLIDRGGSRIKITDLFSLPFEFLKIHSYYSKLQKKGK